MMGLPMPEQLELRDSSFSALNCMLDRSKSSMSGRGRSTALR